MAIRNEVVLSIALTAAALVGCSKPKLIAPPEPPPVTTPIVEIPPVEIPKMIPEENLSQQHYLRKAEYLVRETGDVNLRTWLSVRLLSIRLAEKRLMDLKAKEVLTPTERREIAEVAAAIEETARDINRRVERAYYHYRVNFIKSDKTDLEGQPLADLKAIAPMLKDGCTERREIHVIGWGCARGPMEATQHVSDQRAATVVDWIEKHCGCPPKSLRRGGQGVHTPDEPGLDSDALEALRAKHRFSEILVLRDSELSAIPPMEDTVVPAGTLVDSDRTYDNKALGFRISLPRHQPEWHIVPEPKDTSGVSVVLWGGGGQVQVIWHQLSVGSDTPEMLELIAQQIRQPRIERSIGYHEISSGLVKSKVATYYELQYESLIGSGRMRFRERIFLRGKGMIMVVAMATTERWESLQPAIQEVLDSLVIGTS